MVSQRSISSIRNTRALVLAALLCLFLLLQSSTSLAQEVAPATANAELARRSLKGPVLEIVGGGVLVLSAPALGALAVTATGAKVICVSDENNCSERRRDARPVWLGVSLSAVVVGVAMAVHGGYRIHEVRSARRATLAPRRVSLRLDDTVAAMELEWRF